MGIGGVFRRARERSFAPPGGVRNPYVRPRVTLRTHPRDEPGILPGEETFSARSFVVAGRGFNAAV
ncbi:hypothetical protein Pen01_58890 [Phytomonospora endophytica]|nr:hypothetical protein Pen01_58890 [Phytomonospora endophytica]